MVHHKAFHVGIFHIVHQLAIGIVGKPNPSRAYMSWFELGIYEKWVSKVIYASVQLYKGPNIYKIQTILLKSLFIQFMIFI